MEMRYFSKLFGISYIDHITNKESKTRLENATGPHEDILSSMKRHKLKLYGHVTRSSGQGTVKGGRRRGGQKTIGRQHLREDRP